MDVGCGTAYGSDVMSRRAKFIFAVDPEARACPQKVNMVPIAKNIFNVRKKVDVCIAIEVIEHVPNPTQFVKHLSTLCDWAFITTPLALKTGKTRNRFHVAEYSKEDFRCMVSTAFNILETRYQLGDLGIVDEAAPNGDSDDDNHVVQMVWCKKRGE